MLPDVPGLAIVNNLTRQTDDQRCVKYARSRCPSDILRPSLGNAKEGFELIGEKAKCCILTYERTRGCEFYSQTRP
jgi:hypothetical protein